MLVRSLVGNPILMILGIWLFTLIGTSQSNLDIFFVNGETIQDLVYKGVVDPRFKREELKSACPANPTYVVDFRMNSTNPELYVVTQEVGTVTIKDLQSTAPTQSFSAEPHIQHKLPLNYSCSPQQSWKPQQFSVDYSAASDPSKHRSYTLRFHVNCEQRHNRFDIGLGFVSLAAVSLAVFGACKDRPTGAVASSFVRETTVVNLSKAVVWVVGLSVVMMLVAYFGVYMDLTLAVFYGLVGLVTLQLVLEDLLFWALPNKLNGLVYKRIKVRDVIAFLVSLVVSLLYAWKRHWVFNNIIAACTGISLISMIEIRTFRFGLFFFTVLFIIDVFWLYNWIPKSDTKDLYKYQGQDVNAPFKLLVPRLQSSPYTSCARMGLGDIIVPGMMMRFLRLFDNRRVRPQLARASSNPIIGTSLTPVPSSRAHQHYFLASFLCFGAILTIWTFGHYFWTKSYPPQLYMCPSMLMVIIGLAIYKKELDELWVWEELEHRHEATNQNASSRGVGLSNNAGTHPDEPEHAPNQSAGGHQYIALGNHSDGE